MMDFHIFKSTLKSKMLMGRPTLQKLSIGVSTTRSLVEFPTMARLALVKIDYSSTYAGLAVVVEESNIKEIQWEPILGDNPMEEKVTINPNS